MYNPLDWYWLANDGRLFSSSHSALVNPDDAEFVEWKKQGDEPTRWPSDDDGNQTEAALRSVLAPYGVIVSASLLDAARQRRLAELTERCASEIVGGYDSDALGSLHTYPSKQVDQLNMMGSVTDALTPDQSGEWSTPFWCATAAGEWAFRQHTAPQIIAAGQAGKAHVVACQTTLASLSAQVLSAGTVEEIDAVTWPAV